MCVRSDILIARNIVIMIFWNVKPRRLGDISFSEVHDASIFRVAYGGSEFPRNVT
jgi:hypothetical protein